MSRLLSARSTPCCPELVAGRWARRRGALPGSHRCGSAGRASTVATVSALSADEACTGRQSPQGSGRDREVGSPSSQQGRVTRTTWSRGIEGKLPPNGATTATRSREGRAAGTPPTTKGSPAPASLPPCSHPQLGLAPRARRRHPPPASDATGRPAPLARPGSAQSSASTAAASPVQQPPSRSSPRFCLWSAPGRPTGRLGVRRSRSTACSSRHRFESSRAGRDG